MIVRVCFDSPLPDTQSSPCLKSNFSVVLFPGSQPVPCSRVPRSSYETLRLGFYFHPYTLHVTFPCGDFLFPSFVLPSPFETLLYVSVSVPSVTVRVPYEVYERSRPSYRDDTYLYRSGVGWTSPYRMRWCPSYTDPLVQERVCDLSRGVSFSHSGRTFNSVWDFLDCPPPRVCWGTSTRPPTKNFPLNSLRENSDFVGLWSHSTTVK